MNEPIRKTENNPESFYPKNVPEILTMAQHASFATDVIADPFAGNEPPRSENRIKNYRRLQSWENYFLASAVCSVAIACGADEAALKEIGGETMNNGFHYFSAITGDMFTVLYSTEGPCDSGLTNYFFLPQVIKKAYAAFGRECIYVSNAQIKNDYRAVMNAIKASVDKGIPVLGWGMGGVTTHRSVDIEIPEGCLVGGYDGDLLYANIYIGEEGMPIDEDGYAPVPNGLALTKGLFFVGDEIEPSDMRGVYTRAIEDIPVFLSAAPADGYYFGKSAFEKWADTILDESRFTDKSDDEINGICWDFHCSPYCNICTSAANHYIRAAAEDYDIETAKKLRPIYDRFVERRQFIWNDLHGDFFPPAEKFRQREFREQIAAVLREMGGICEEILAVFAEV
jgi:hypothetical protein